MGTRRYRVEAAGRKAVIKRDIDGAVNAAWAAWRAQEGRTPVLVYWWDRDTEPRLAGRIEGDAHTVDWYWLTDAEVR